MSKLKLGVAHPVVGVDLFLQASDLGEVLPHRLLQMQDAAALLLRVTGNLQLETHALLFLAVLLIEARTEDRTFKKKKILENRLLNGDSPVQPKLLATLRLGSTCNKRLLTMSRIMAYWTGLVEISRSW